MKAMGLHNLVLVAPARFPHADASARASGADDLLAAAQIVASLDAAIADCGLVIATSARGRSLPWPVVDPRAAAHQARASALPVAVVFGRERSGLSNDELDRCHLHLQIPTDPAFSSLNLAAAVQIICYELRCAAGRSAPGPAIEAPATAAELEGLYEHLRTVSEASGFLDPDQPRVLMRRFRRLFGRARIEAAELRMLRGLLSAVDPRRG